MQIELNAETEKLLKVVLATGRYGSVGEIIADVAGQLQTPPVSPMMQRMPEHVEVEELARVKGIGPVKDFRALRADFFPPEETTDEFLSFLRTDNRQDAPRVI